MKLLMFSSRCKALRLLLLLLFASSPLMGEYDYDFFGGRYYINDELDFTLPIIGDDVSEWDIHEEEGEGSIQYLIAGCTPLIFSFRKDSIDFRALPLGSADVRKWIQDEVVEIMIDGAETHLDDYQVLCDNGGEPNIYFTLYKLSARGNPNCVLYYSELSEGGRAFTFLTYFSEVDVFNEAVRGMGITALDVHRWSIRDLIRDIRNRKQVKKAKKRKEELGGLGIVMPYPTSWMLQNRIN